jgi:oxalate decarboxylase/phosphoglucose isomerase-like protein (cupin superfamily)
MGRFHRENAQEGFLVLAGTCLLIVEEEERTLQTWDFFHCPPQTEHIIVGAGDGPSVVLAVGARGLRRKGLVYTESVAAQARGAGVERETRDPREAYAPFRPWSRCRYREGWLPDL